MKLLRFGYALLWTAVFLLMIASCSDDDEPKVTAYHQSYVKGKVNDEDIAMNDLNSSILSEKSMYEFRSNSQSDIPVEFDWQVKLMETKDSIVTLYLHIDDVDRINCAIYSPNDKELLKTPNTCYVAVTDLNKQVTKVYHPTHSSPIFAKWETFMVTADSGVDIDYVGHRWPGIEGRVNGILTCDDAVPGTMKIDINFRLY